MTQNTLITYPGYWYLFDAQMNMSNCQIYRGVSEKGKPVTYFSRNPNELHDSCKLFLAIVETLNNIGSILFGPEIKPYTDHENVTGDNTNFSSGRILRQIIVLEEYGADIIYFPGEKNNVADALSRLNSRVDKHLTLDENLFKRSFFIPVFLFHLNLQQYLSTNRKTKSWKFKKKQRKEEDFLPSEFQPNHPLDCYQFQNDDHFMYVPAVLHDHLLDWYHQK